jgi:WD40 repeat protein
LNRADIKTIAFTRSGDRILSFDASRQSVLWAAPSGLATPQALEMNGTFSAGDRFAGFSRGEGKVRLWRVESGRELRVLDNPLAARPEDMLCGWAFDGTGRIFGARSLNLERFSFIDTESGEELARISGPAGAAQPFDFKPDPLGGGWLTGGTRGVMFWPLRSEPGRPASLTVGPPQTLLPGPGKAHWALSGASHDGKALAITDVTSTLLIRRDDVPGPPLILGSNYMVGHSAISPDGKWVATCSDGSGGGSASVQIWNGQTGQFVAALPLTGRHIVAGFSPDNQWLTTHDLKDEAHLWKVGAWDKRVNSFAGGRFVFSPNSELIAVNDVIGCVRLLKTASGEEVARLTGPESRTYWPQCFTPDGTKLITMGGDGLCMWDLRLIREQLQAMELDWNCSPFSPAVLDPRGRLHLTVDTGISAPEGPGAASPRPQEPTAGQGTAR